MERSEEDPKMNEEMVALQHELRRKIMRVLGSSDDPISPREVSGELQQPLPNVSYHVRVLAKCKVITLVHTKPVRGSMQHFYRPDPSFIGQAWVVTVLGIEPATGTA